MKPWFRDLRTVLGKDLKSVARVRKYFFPVVVPPLVIFVVFAALATTASPETMRLLLVDEDETPASLAMAQTIENVSSEFGPWFQVVREGSYEEAKAKLASFQFLGLVVIPPGFGANVSAGLVGVLRLEVQNVNDDYVKNYVQRLDEVVLEYSRALRETDGGFGVVVEKSNLIGERGTGVSALRGIAVGAVALYSVLAGLGVGAINTAKEFDEGTFSEVANSPVSWTAYAASKQVLSLLVGALVTVTFGGLLWLVAGIPFRGNFWLLLAAFCLNTWFHSNLGVLLGLAVRRTAPVLIVTIFSSIFLWLFGGGFAPAKVLGSWVYAASRYVPATYWTEVLFSEAFLPNLAYSLPRVGILVSCAAVGTPVAWGLLKRGWLRY
ncbi:MAG: hypothetical protein Kow0069_08790 [Promethearchaeota archaeon]